MQAWTGIPELLSAVSEAQQVGHPHFWERAVSRRRFLGTTALATGAAVTAGVLVPGVASAAPPGPGTPRPIPQTFDGTPFHVQLPAPGSEPSLITDFSGQTAIADILGTAVGGAGEPTGLTFDADMRFMTGHFVGTDGRVHQGAFGFV
jgi:hypothetical protein